MDSNLNLDDEEIQNEEEEEEEAFEEFQFGSKEFMDLPSGLTENPFIIDEILSESTWNSLSENTQKHLKSFLPIFPENDSNEKELSLSMLFSKDNFHFGNPLTKFKSDLSAGSFHPDIVKMKKLLQKSQEIISKQRMKERNFCLLSQILTSRKQCFESQTPLSVLKMSQKSFKVLPDIRHKISKRYFHELKRIRAAVGEFQDSSSEDECYPNGPPIIKSPRKEIQLYESEPWTSELPLDQPLEEIGKDKYFDVAVQEAVSNIPGLSHDLEDSRQLLVDLLEPSESGDYYTPTSYFSLLRDTFQSRPNFQISIPELEESISNWELEIREHGGPFWASLLSNWTSSIPSSIAFLSGSFPEAVPLNFSPYIDVEPSTGIYRWLLGSEDSDSHLESLTTWWFERRDSCRAITTGCNSWSVTSSSESEKINRYHIQEKIRYSKPEKSMTYHFDGYSTTVGPIKSLSSYPSKAKAHALLTSERPPYVTILNLVKDAVARLPNGEGTRSDIVELLKDSQYINSLVMECHPMLTSAVSGALDRLQSEMDPCVKYESVKKTWIYLHRGRTESDFMRIHSEHLSLPKSALKPKRQKSRKVENFPSPEEAMMTAVESILPSDPQKDSSIQQQVQQQQQQQVQQQQQQVPQQQQQTIQLMTPNGVQTYQLNIPKSSCSLEKKESSFRGTSVLLNKVTPSPSIQRVIVKNSEGKPVHLTADTLQKLLASGALKTRRLQNPSSSSSSSSIQVFKQNIEKPSLRYVQYSSASGTSGSNVMKILSSSGVTQTLKILSPPSNSPLRLVNGSQINLNSASTQGHTVKISSPSLSGIKVPISSSSFGTSTKYGIGSSGTSSVSSSQIVLQNINGKPIILSQGAHLRAGITNLSNVKIVQSPLRGQIVTRIVNSDSFLPQS